jgi:hypothetical protein
MTLRPGHIQEKSSAQRTEWGPDPNDQRLWMIYELDAWHPQYRAISLESSGEKNPDYPSGLVITTHTHDDFEWPSLRHYVDTKSWLAYE